MRRVRLTWLLIGVLVGGIIAGPGGLTLSLELTALHPGFAGRVESQLRNLSVRQETTPIGNLGDERVTVSVHARGRPISPYIYGVAIAPPGVLRTLGATMNRWGGDNSR